MGAEPGPRAGRRGKDTARWQKQFGGEQGLEVGGVLTYLGMGTERFRTGGYALLSRHATLAHGCIRARGVTGLHARWGRHRAACSLGPSQGCMRAGGVTGVHARWGRHRAACALEASQGCMPEIGSLVACV